MPPTLPDRKELVWIVWKDACDSSSRVHVDSIKDVQLVCNANLGWILDENEERVVLGHGLSTSGEIDHFVIPANCIIRRERVVTPRRERCNSAKPNSEKP
jgi:hypothetical protein